MKVGNATKSLFGIFCYPGLVLANMTAEIVVRVTDPWCAWFEKDLPHDRGDRKGDPASLPDSWRAK
jgi:hypothetical protein